MARQIELRVVELTVELLGASIVPTPAWLIRPGRIDAGERWPLVCEIYTDLTGLELPDSFERITRKYAALIAAEAEGVIVDELAAEQ